MKYLIIFVALLFSSCAHVTEYGQGCRDGVKGLEPQLTGLGLILSEPDMVDHYCDQVESRRKDSGKK